MAETITRETKREGQRKAKRRTARVCFTCQMRVGNEKIYDLFYMICYG
jgi:hypothetical protein